MYPAPSSSHITSSQCEIVPIEESQPISSSTSSNKSRAWPVHGDPWLQTFHELDANGDGKLSAEEVRRVLAVMAKGSGMEDEVLLQQEAEAMVAEADQNGDGFVDLSEFIQLGARISQMDAHHGQRDRDMADGVGGQSSSSSSAVVASHDEDLDEEERLLEDTFHVFDSDGDGRITAEELHTVLSLLDPHGFDASITSLVSCRRIINAINTDGSGYVNFEQFKRMMMM